MAWVKQEFLHNSFRVILEEHETILGFDDSYRGWTYITPETKDDAHSWAMMLRRAARRLEEIGKDLK